MKSPHPADTRMNPNLDFLRACAVLLVLLGHLTRFFGVDQVGRVALIGLGGLGVAMFFVHTALVLMLSLEREAAGAQILFVPFMIRRCFRIYPLAMFVIAAVMVLHAPQATVSPGHFAGWNFDRTDALANLFLVQDLSFRVPIVGPTWSLSFELQMYLLLPGVFLFLRRGWPAWQLGIVLTMLVGLCAVVVQHSTTRNLAFFMPCFLAGIVAYQLQKYVYPVIPAFAWPAFVTGVAAVYLMSKMTRWDEWLVCFVLGLGIPAFTRMTSRAVDATSAMIAKYSYGIYLTHFFVIWLAFEKLAGAPVLLSVAVFLGLGAALPVIFYHAVEEPMIQFGKRMANSYVRGR